MQNHRGKNKTKNISKYILCQINFSMDRCPLSHEIQKDCSKQDNYTESKLNPINCHGERSKWTQTQKTAGRLKCSISFVQNQEPKHRKGVN